MTRGSGGVLTLSRQRGFHRLIYHRLWPALCVSWILSPRDHQGRMIVNRNLTGSVSVKLARTTRLLPCL